MPGSDKSRLASHPHALYFVIPDSSSLPRKETFTRLLPASLSSSAKTICGGD